MQIRVSNFKSDWRVCICRYLYENTARRITVGNIIHDWINLLVSLQRRSLISNQSFCTFIFRNRVSVQFPLINFHFFISDLKPWVVNKTNVNHSFIFHLSILAIFIRFFLFRYISFLCIGGGGVRVKHKIALKIVDDNVKYKKSIINICFRKCCFSVCSKLCHSFIYWTSKY